MPKNSYEFTLFFIIAYLLLIAFFIGIYFMLIHLKNLIKEWAAEVNREVAEVNNVFKKIIKFREPPDKEEEIKK